MQRPLASSSSCSRQQQQQQHGRWWPPAAAAATRRAPARRVLPGDSRQGSAPAAFAGCDAAAARRRRRPGGSAVAAAPAGVQPPQRDADEQARASSSSSGRPDGVGEYILFTADELKGDGPPAPAVAAEGPDGGERGAPEQAAAGASTGGVDGGGGGGSGSGSSSESKGEVSDSTAGAGPASAAQQQPDQQRGDQGQEQEQGDSGPQPAAASATGEAGDALPPPQEDNQQQQQRAAAAAAAAARARAPGVALAPPPLVDPHVDIANDPAYAIRLLDILDRVPATGSASGTAAAAGAGGAPSGRSVEAVAEPEAGAGAQQASNSSSGGGGGGVPFVRQPAAFCTNCCTPLDPLRPAAACGACGHLPANDGLLFSLGASSEADLAATTPQWLLQRQGRAGAGEGTGAGAAASAAERLSAGIALRQARQALRDAGVLQLPSTVLAWEDEEADPEPAMQLHRGLLPPNHERPERLRAVLARLRSAGLLDACDYLEPREATDEELLSVHTPGLVAAVAALSTANQPSDLNSVAAHLSPDMLGNRYTYRAARTAAGTAAELARQLATGQAGNGMAIIRPVGHSATEDSGEGGSYFNNAAVAARAAQRAGARRVMIVDWDVHHSKGTSQIFAEDPNVLVFSLHRYGSGFFPGTGPAEYVGAGRGRGRTINVAWCPPTIVDKRGRRIQVDAPPVADGDYVAAWTVLLLPVAQEFRPDAILVSAGFDAADKDPLGHYRVHPECFGLLTSLLRPLAPLGLLLEGGYNLAATAAGAEACVRALLGERPAPLRGTRCAGVTGWSSVLRTLLVHQEHWQSLAMLNFLQLATPTAEEWQDGEEAEEEEEGEEEEGEEEEGEEAGAAVELGAEDEEGEGEEEYELSEEEFEAAMAEVAAGNGQAGGGAASAATAAAAAQLEPREVLDALQSTPDLMQQVLDLLDRKIAAGGSAQGSGAAIAGPAAEQQQLAQQEQQRQEQRAGQPPGPEPRAAGGWSAGGFLDDAEGVDSGTDDEAASPQLRRRTDWGLEQIDEEVEEHLDWTEHVRQELRRAEGEAAAAAAAAAAGTAAPESDGGTAAAAARGLAGAKPQPGGGGSSTDAAAAAPEHSAASGAQERGQPGAAAAAAAAEPTGG